MRSGFPALVGLLVLFGVAYWYDANAQAIVSDSNPLTVQFRPTTTR